MPTSIIGNLPDTMPHDSVKIIPNTTYTSVAETKITDPIAFFAFVSPKGYGKDNNLVTIGAAEALKYGTPNLSKWGVSLYNLRQYINGGGTVLGMRVVADDSTHANLAVSAMYQIKLAEPYLDDTGAQLYKDTNGNITTTATGNTAIVRDVLYVKLTTQSFSGTKAQSSDALLTALDALKNDTADADGWKTLPLFAVYNVSKGSFANNRFVRMAFDPAMESDILTNRFYRLTEAEDGESVLDGTVSFTMDRDYIYGGTEAMFLEDVVSNYAKDTDVVISTHFDTFMQLVHDSGLDADAGETSANQIDILFGLTKENTKHYKYLLDPASVSLSNTSGLALAGGSDGAFALTSSTRTSAMSTAMANAYKGTTNDMIFDEVRYPFIHVFDNDDDIAVKEAVASLVNARYTTCGILSAPATIKNYSEMDSLRASSYKFSSFKIFLYTENAMIRDPYTGKKVRMPASYFNAKAFAARTVNKGFGTPFAGQYMYWDGFIQDTVRPRTSSTDVVKKQHTNRVNQMNEDGKGYAYPYEQITSQSTTDKLSEINNVHVLLFMIRICLETAKVNRWSFATDEDVTKYQKTVKDAIDVNLNGLYDSIDVQTQRESLNGAGKNRIRAMITVNFKDVLKGISYEFYIQ